MVEGRTKKKGVGNSRSIVILLRPSKMDTIIFIISATLIPLLAVQTDSDLLAPQRLKPDLNRSLKSEMLVSLRVNDQASKAPGARPG